MKIKCKKIILILLTILLLCFIFSIEVCAVDDLTNKVVTKMQNQRMGVTVDTTFTKILRTFFAVAQIALTGGSLIYFTGYCVKFFNVFSADDRAKAKKGLWKRLLGLCVVLGANFILTLILDLVTP